MGPRAKDVFERPQILNDKLFASSNPLFAHYIQLSLLELDLAAQSSWDQQLLLHESIEPASLISFGTLLNHWPSDDVPISNLERTPVATTLTTLAV